MKKLNLLKPEQKSGYLGGGLGQEVRYLQVTNKTTKKAMQQDIAAGATFLEEIAKQVEKTPTQTVIIQCKNEEIGMVALSYLASINNAQEGIDFEEGDGDDFIDEESQKETYEDFDSAVDWWEDDHSSDDDSWEDEIGWIETPWKIPIVTMREICEHSPKGEDIFGGPFSMGAQFNTNRPKPYWYNARSESICLINYMGIYNPYDITQPLKRFKKNRHIYILIVNPDISDEFGGVGDYAKQQLLEFVLEFSADVITLDMSETQINQFTKVLFDNWLHNYHLKLKSGFPKAKIVKQVLQMNNPNKAALIENIVKYVKRRAKDPNALVYDDFNVLSQFSAVQKVIQSKKENSKIELVGMERVKDQINGIVDVMKYNKRRAALGMEDGEYHNVHMLVGAPGTAKTTVAQMLGKMMFEENLLQTNRFIAVNGAELKGKYVGHSAPKVKALFEEYDIILIDEAYAVCAGHEGESDSFSQEAIAQLIIELENHGTDKLVLFAGYGGDKVDEKDNRMYRFLQTNPGLRSRINSTIFFDSYDENQMLDIVCFLAKKNHYVIPKEAHKDIIDYFHTRVKEPDFGNGREARSLLENTTMEAAKRVAQMPEEDITEKVLKTLTEKDFRNAIDKISKGMEVQQGQKRAVCGFAGCK